MAELVYETERVSLWCGDAAEVLPSLKTESFDLVLTDPPYGVEYQSGMRAEKFEQLANDGADMEARGNVELILEHCVRLTGQNRHLYVFGPEVLRAADMKVSAPAQLFGTRRQWRWETSPRRGVQLTSSSISIHVFIDTAASAESWSTLCVFARVRCSATRRRLGGRSAIPPRSR